jgi:hypothetical protein
MLLLRSYKGNVTDVANHLNWPGAKVRAAISGLMQETGLTDARLSLVCSRHWLEINAVPQNHLGNQVVGRAGESHTEAKIDLPLWRDIKSIAGKTWCCCCETGSNPVTGPTEP